MEKTLLVLIDGHALVHRAFHALPPLSVSRTGEPTGAVYGFVNMLLKTLHDLKPTHWAIAFDLPTPTFRHIEYEEYKARRPKTPDELIRQFRRVREIVEGFKMPVFEVEGYEADDVLGTVARQASSEGVETIIVTGDNDELQLVSENVKVLLPQKTFGEISLHDVGAVREKFAVEPQQIPDLKALKGDPSDNIPGVPGVGGKTASRLIQQFGSIEGIYDHIQEVAPQRLKDLLIAEEANARQGKHLATIVTDVPVQFDLAKCKAGDFDRDRLIQVFRELEFYRMLDRLPTVDSSAAARQNSFPPEGAEHEIVADEDAVERMLQELSLSNRITVHLVCVQRGRFDTDIVAMALCASPERAYYLPFGGGGRPHSRGSEVKIALSRLGSLMTGGTIAKVAHNGKQLMNRLKEHGIELNNLDFDTMIAAHLLGEKSLSLQSLALSRLGIEIRVVSDRKTLKLNLIDHEDVAAGAKAACEAVVIARLLYDALRPELEREELMRLFQEVEMPLVPLLARMERNGVALDTGLFRAMSCSLGERLEGLESQIYSYAGRRFNINSPQQLGTVLFGELRIPGGKRTKSGYSTEAAVLEGLKSEFPIVKLILDYRQLAKLKSTYIDALPAMISPVTGRLHTTFNQTATVTGRLSSSEPNLQNIPIRGELGRQVRRAFVAADDWLLVSGDYSQIDLRVLAHLSQEPRLLEAFRQDQDIHTATAAEVFAVRVEDVTPEMRRVAKVVNFGIIYGMSDYGLEHATDLTRQQATVFIDTYFHKHPGVRDYLESTKKTARETGCVETLLGRRRYISELDSTNRQVREAAERMAINMPVQGTAADIIKVAMVRLQKELDRRRLKSKIILQIHDELLLEVPQEEMDEAKEVMKETMTGAMELKAPLKVDIKAGKNWGDMDLVA